MTTPTTVPWEGCDVIGREKRDLPVALTNEELRSRGEQLGLQLLTIDTMAEAHKAVRADQKAELGEAKAEAARLADIMRSGKEARPVDTAVLADFAAELAYVVRTDTSELVERRRLTADERQLRLGPGHPDLRVHKGGRSFETTDAGDDASPDADQDGLPPEPEDGE